jgi:carboxyl-terminal processing protease
MQPISKTRHITAVVLLVVIFFVFGFYMGDKNGPALERVIGVANKETQVVTDVDFDPFWKVWNTINDKYPKDGNVDDQVKVYGAISGLVGSLDDPYSVFFEPESAKLFEEEIAGNFSGVGMEVGIKNKTLTVIAPLKDTPAYRADIKSGDRILKIDEKVTVGMKIEEAIKLIRGERGTQVVLHILHEGDSEPVDIKITRDIIEIPTLDTEVRPDGIFVIKLYSFSANSTDLFRKAIREFALSGLSRLVLDLRGNPGGYLNAAVDVSSWFLSAGKVVVTEDYSDSRKPEVFRSRGYDVFTDNLKFVILVDGGSASASEIVAGAMQDHSKATLVGGKTFGKGSVQEALKITPDTLLKITVAKWLTPNGNQISEVGLTPDYEVEVTKEDIEKKHDPQMEKAVELLLLK